MKFSVNQLFKFAEEDGGNYRADGLTESYAFCHWLATEHYENFPVGSIFIPAHERPHIYAVYAFSRIADDIADELTDIDPERRIKALDRMKERLDDHIPDFPANPIFAALNYTMRKLAIPEDVPARLIEAFKQDVNFRQPDDWDNLMNYCDKSANPVGELILRIFDDFDENTKKYSDMICTGLQLVNFWQDLSRDILKKRYYIPKKILEKYDINELNLQEKKNSHKIRLCLNEIYEKTEGFFQEGRKLVPLLSSLRLRLEIAATVYGGRKVLKMTRKKGIKILQERPSVKYFGKFAIAFKTLLNPAVIFKWNLSRK